MMFFLVLVVHWPYLDKRYKQTDNASFRVAFATEKDPVFIITTFLLTRVNMFFGKRIFE